MTATIEPSATAPVVDRFERPSLLWYLAFDGGIGLLGAMSVSQDVYDKVSASIPLPPRSQVQAMFYGSVALHVVEAGLAHRMAKARGMHASAGRYARHAFIVGFPALLKIRKVSKGG